MSRSAHSAPRSRPPAGEVDPRLLEELAEFYKVLGDPTRLRILQALMREELCVHLLAASLGMQQSAISHQLRILKHAQLVRARRVGKEARYSLRDEHVRSIFEQGLTHVDEGGRW